MKIKNILLGSMLSLSVVSGLAMQAHAAPIHEAACRGDVDELRQLIHNEATVVNAKDEDGFTPLMRAALEGHIDFLKALIEAKADVNTRDNTGWTALAYAVCKSHKDIVDELIQANVDVNIRENDGCTPLMYAAITGATNIAEQLIQANSDVIAKDENGYTPLMYAVLQRRTSVVRLLISHLTIDEIGVTNNENKNALDIAREKNYQDIIELIENRVFQIRGNKTKSAANVAS